MFKTFAELIAGATHGEIDEIASKEYLALVNEMRNLENTIGGKQKGVITLKVAFTLERGTFDTQAEVSVKHPPKVRPRAFLYPQKDGSLSEEDTRQGTLFDGAKDVSTPGTANVRDIKDVRSAAANDR